MKASEWIDRVKQARGWDSDYRAASELGLGRATISKYRTKATTLDDEAALRVASALQLEPAIILLDQAAERAKSDEVRGAITKALQRITAAGLTAFAFMGGPGSPPPAVAADGASTLIVMSNRRRKRTSVLARMADSLRALAGPLGLISTIAPYPA